MLDRRGFLGGGAALAGMALGGRRGLAGAVPGGRARVDGGGASPVSPAARLGRAAAMRREAAELEGEGQEGRHPTNGDADLPGAIACYSKGLPHNTLGEVDGAAYALLLRALASGEPRDFEAIPLGGFVKLSNPQAGLAFNLVGPDPAGVRVEPPPRFASAEQGRAGRAVLAGAAARRALRRVRVAAAGAAGGRGPVAARGS